MARMSSSRSAAGLAAALTLCVASLLYGAALLFGLAARARPEDPVPDPWLGGMQGLILVIAPCLVILIWSVAGRAPEPRRRRGRVALAFMAASAAITLGVHLTLLAGPREAAADAFRWPSPFYALDVLAWDVFFALSVLLAAPLVSGGPVARLVRWLMVLSGLLALAGLAGVPTGDMGLRNIGILGYAVVFPLAAAGMAVVFSGGRPGSPSCRRE